MTWMMAAVTMIATQLGNFREGGFTVVFDEWAARVKFTSGRTVEQTGHFTLKFEAVDYGIGVRLGIGR